MKYNLGYLFDLLVVITNKDLKVRYKQHARLFMVSSKSIAFCHDLLFYI
ncbi:hypothetical protein BANRA_05230 [Klebsiella pneumoniae]|nr:hypothetical protein BANRA_05230 [Klebsiella pneumoniae]